MPNCIKIVMADDHKMFLEALSEKLEQSPTIKILGVAENGEAVLSLLSQHKVDIAILDLAMPRMNGAETFEVIRKEHKGVRVIILSEHYNISLYRSFYQRGVAAYLPKQCGVEVLREAINSVYEKGNYTRMFNTLPEDAKGYSFSDIEMMIIQHIAAGKSNPQIATQMKRSVNTINTHCKNIFSKAEVNSRNGLLLFASKMGFISTHNNLFLPPPRMIRNSVKINTWVTLNLFQDLRKGFANNRGC